MQDVARGIPACRCGRDGRLKQQWVIEGGGNVARLAALLLPEEDHHCKNSEDGCGSICWRVFEDRPFETTAWREDLVACGCGAEARLKQQWGSAYQRYLDRDDVPKWLQLKYGLSNSGMPMCATCDLAPWPVVPGVLVGFPEHSAWVDQGFVDANLAYVLKMIRSCDMTGRLKILNEAALIEFLRAQDWPQRGHAAVVPVIRRRLFTGEEG